MNIKEIEDFNTLNELLNLILENPYNEINIELKEENNLIKYLTLIIQFINIYEIESIINNKILPKITVKYKNKEYKIYEIIEETNNEIIMNDIITL